MNKFFYFLLLFISAKSFIIYSMDNVPAVFESLPKGVKQYLDDLPKIKKITSNNAEEQSEAIVDFLLRFGRYFNPSVPGKKELQNKIEACIKNNQPIERCIPAFPCATKNPDKNPFDDEHAFGLGDLVALLTRNHISAEIAKIYSHGSSISIYWEPWIQDLNKISEDNLGYTEFPQKRIDRYQETLSGLITYLEPNVKLGVPSVTKMDQLYWVSYSKIPVQADPEKIKGYAIFFEEDLNSEECTNKTEEALFKAQKETIEKKFPRLKGKSFEAIKQDPAYTKRIKSLLSSKAKIKEVSKILGKAAVEDSQRQGILMEKEIPDFDKKIRESVRPDPSSVQKKLGTPMIYGTNGTPWHNVLVVSDIGIRLTKYQDVIKYDQEPTTAFYKIGDYELSYIIDKKLTLGQ